MTLTDVRPPQHAEPEPLSSAEREAVAALREILESSSYAQLYAQATEGALYAPDPARSLAEAATLPPLERVLVSLLALGAAIRRSAIPVELARLLAKLADAGLLEVDDEVVTTTGWVVVSVLRGYLLAGVPSTYPGRRAIGASGYIGNDSLTLAASLPSTNGKRVLDLGAGSGIQGILAAAGASEAVLSDIDPFGLRLAALNIALNAPTHPMRLACGDGYEPLGDERFDLIVTLPPYLPSVQGAGTSSVVDGGRDGLALIRRLIFETAPRLNPGGELFMLCQLLCDDEGPLLARELDVLCPELDSRLALFAWTPLQPYLAELTSKLAAHGAPADRSTLVSAYSSSLRALGVNGVCGALIRLRRSPVTAVAPRRELLGDVPNRHASDIVVARDRLRVEAATELRVVCADSLGLAAVLDGPGGALAGAIDGVASIAEVAERAWGLPVGAATEDLREQAIARLVDLQRRGLVTFEVRG